MSTLLILLPATPPPQAGPQDYEYWFSADAQAPASRGQGERAPLAELPRADQVIAVIGDDQVSWLPVRLPSLKGARLRNALVGMLEEQVLDDPERLHFAIMDSDDAPASRKAKLALQPLPPPPDKNGGGDTVLMDGSDAPQWVAITAREPLRLHLEAIEAAGLALEAVYPLSWPQLRAGGHVVPGADGRPRLRAWTSLGVATFPLDSSGIRTWLGERWLAEAVVSASPAVAGEAEKWLGRPVDVRNDTERAWLSRQAPINLLQLEFTPRQRGWQRIYRGWQVLQTPAWRPVRWGLVGLLLVQVVGLNLMAWQQSRAVDARRNEQELVLRQAFPQVRTIRDARAQMVKETETLRGGAGQIGPGDMEDLLAAVARAWPAGQPPLPGLRYESNRLQLTGLPPPVRQQLRERLVQEPGLSVTDEGDSLNLSLRPQTR
ncbi:type II secretion system protein GspL [Roseateles amylovorans]|uniref:Type II secretion system protein GspL n=1 Tax=Roseateles amylovorans TaxID=2978473 RepID=A0ABY6B1N8_9BURK|nr:type II secretion system protein GspL [Roseateles amylovorans]UXH79317.1 type II secretion system protein GspL [Roseateles amylovorans]